MGKKRGADVAELGAQVLSVAEALRLTEQQRLFAEALAADPEKNQTKAALAAGCATQPAIQGSRWARMGKVRAYLAYLTSTAVQKVERETGQVVSTLAESLAFLTTVQRTHIADPLGDDGKIDLEKLRAMPAGVVRRIRMHENVTTLKDGSVHESVEHGVELESAVSAAKTIIGHYHAVEGEERLGDLAEALKTLPSDTVAAIARAMLAGRQMKAIDVTARVVQ